MRAPFYTGRPLPYILSAILIAGELLPYSLAVAGANLDCAGCVEVAKDVRQSISPLLMIGGVLALVVCFWARVQDSKAKKSG